MKQDYKKQPIQPDDKIGRFAVSLLSRDKVDTSLPYEVMIDHNTGHVFVKDPEGNFLSQPVTNNIYNHANELTRRCMNMNIAGEILNVEIPGVAMPLVVTENVDVLRASGFTLENVDKVMISLDLTTLDLNTVTLSEISQEEPVITIKYTLSGDSLPNRQTVVKSMGLRELNSKPLLIASNDYDASNLTLTINGITINRNPAVSSSVNARFILNSILVCAV